MKFQEKNTMSPGWQNRVYKGWINHYFKKFNTWDLREGSSTTNSYFEYNQETPIHLVKNESNGTLKPSIELVKTKS